MIFSDTPQPSLQNILSINEIRLNQHRSQLSLSYNNGINIHSTSDFRMLYSSNEYDFTLGSVSQCAMIYNSSTVAFVGGTDNPTYSNFKLVLYDLNSKSEINSILLKEAITSVDIVFSFLIISTAKEIQVYSFKDEQNLFLVHTIELKNQHQQCPFIVWTTTVNQDIDKVNVCTFSEKKNKLTVHTFFSREFEFDKEEAITVSAFSDVQRMFYIKEFKLLLVVEKHGQRLAGISVEHKETQHMFYRGTSCGDISDACGLPDNHIAVVNMKKTIHIYKIEHSKGSYLSYIIPSFFSSNYIYSSIKIRLSDVISNEENLFFKSSYDKHGCIIFNSSENNELIIIGYNGYVYRIKLDLANAKYKVINRDKFVSDELQNQTIYVPTSSEEGEDGKEKWSVI